jgi:hypothetical protein
VPAVECFVVWKGIGMLSKIDILMKFYGNEKKQFTDELRALGIKIDVKLIGLQKYNYRVTFKSQADLNLCKLCGLIKHRGDGMDEYANI